MLNNLLRLFKDALKTDSKRAIQKTAEATGDLIGNKIADKVKDSQSLHQKNNSEMFLDH